MKIKSLLTIVFASVYSLGFSQMVGGPPGYLDSMKYISVTAKDDTIRVLALADLSWSYSFINFDSAALYSQKAQILAQKVKFKRGEVRSLYGLGSAYQTQGDIPKSLALFFKALEIAEQNHYLLESSMCLIGIGNVFSDMHDWPSALGYYNRAHRINETIKNDKSAEGVENLTDINLGWAYTQNNQLDSAAFILGNLYTRTLHDQNWHPAVLLFFGDLQFRLGKQQLAMDYLHQSLKLFQDREEHFGSSDACGFLAGFFKEMKQGDSCIYYAKKGLAESQIINYRTSKFKLSKLLADQYENRDINQAHYYLKLAMATNDELYGPKKVQDLQRIVFDEQERQRQSAMERIAYNNRLKQYAYIAGLSVVLLIAFILFRNNRQKQKANLELQQQKEEIGRQKTRVEKALNELTSTQAQLIQSEKMASLGELTAGIAHEIQNPLNFVNNFSEINAELSEEILDAAAKGDLEEVKVLATDIKSNQEKIREHGKRADSIVKGMLQHSRSSAGSKEPTDLVALADEYLRLAYHGMRAKDKDFNAGLKTDFEAGIPLVPVVAQDIGRVLLNLFNNAFYAVNERKKTAGDAYEPEVRVGIRADNTRPDPSIVITVSDNGSGIPDSIKAKIFQPFFTTKPTGQGTGLGLSLSYDIVKAHRGELALDNSSHSGSSFLIRLPFNTPTE